MSEIHAARRSPFTPEEPLDLSDAGDSLLEEARRMSSGRASRTLTPGAHGALKQTLVALQAGVELDEHVINGLATIQLLRGSAAINSEDGTVQLVSGQWATIPIVRHGVRAGEEMVALITVVPTAPAPGRDNPTTA